MLKPQSFQHFGGQAVGVGAIGIHECTLTPVRCLNGHEDGAVIDTAHSLKTVVFHYGKFAGHVAGAIRAIQLVGLQFEVEGETALAQILQGFDQGIKIFGIHFVLSLKPGMSRSLYSGLFSM